MHNFDELTGAWDYRSLPPNIEIGGGCQLARKSSFAPMRSNRNPGVVLGNRVRAYLWTEFNVEPDGFLEVGDDSILIGAGFMCANHIKIGARVLVSYNVTIADSDFHPIQPELRRLDAIANAPHGDRSTRPPFTSLPVVIEDEVWIGIGAIILKGVTIGRGARVGAGSVITHDIPPGAEASGNPAILRTR